MDNAKITFGAIKADLGAIGHNAVLKEMIDELKKEVELQLRKRKLISDYFIIHFGDDVGFVFTTKKDPEDPELHRGFLEVFWTVGERLSDRAYAAMQDMSERAITSTVRGMGPSYAAFSWTPAHPGETAIFIGIDKTQPGTFNAPLLKIFADSFRTTLGLTNDPNMCVGYRIEVWDQLNKKRTFFNLPEDLYKAQAYLAHPFQFAIKRVFPRKGNTWRNPDEPLCYVSTEHVYEVKGKYAGKDDPICVGLAHSGAPPTGAWLNGLFTDPIFALGWMNGSCYSPVCPIPMEESSCSINDGPSPMVVLTTTIAKDLTLHGYHGGGKYWDHGYHPAAREAARRAIWLARSMLRYGFFQPTVAEREAIETTFRPQVFKKFEETIEWTDIPPSEIGEIKARLPK